MCHWQREGRKPGAEPEYLPWTVAAGRDRYRHGSCRGEQGNTGLFHWWKGLFLFPGQCARLLMAMTGRIMPENTPTAKDARSARRWCCCVLLAVLWCASLPLACLPGPVPVAVADVWQALGAVVGLCPPADGSVQLVVGQIRLARVLLGLLCGGALAVAGVALQGVLRNPLADPFTLGISAGAACGASMAIALGGTLGIWAGGLAVGLSAAATVSLAALLGSLLALGGALWLGSGQGSFRRETVILAGIAVAAFLGAVVALVKALNEESVTSIVFWIMGSLQGRGWDSVPLLLATLLPGLLVVLPGWRKLDMLALGDEQAAHLGLAVGRTRFWLLAGASCMTAGCVAVAGVIGFVGLVVPHVLRMLLGSAHGPLLYGAFLGGGILLVWADVLARCVLSGGQELPVGVVTALLGGPFFAFLVRRR